MGISSHTHRNSAFSRSRGKHVRTLERTAGHLLILVTRAASVIWPISTARAQVTEAPEEVVPAAAVTLHLNEPIKVRHGFENLTGRFAGWYGDRLALRFDIGDPLLLPIEELHQIAARRHSPDRAVGAGLFFGAIAWVTLRVTGVLAGGLTQCKECVRNSDVWIRTGQVVLVTTSLFLVVDYFRPPYRVVYRRPAVPGR